MHKKILLSLVLFLFVFMNTFGQNGKLGKAKESLKDSKSTNYTARETKSSGSAEVSLFEEDVNPFLQIFGALFAYTAYGLLVESPWELNGRMHDAEISNFPYQKNNQGNFIYTDSINYKMARFDIYNHFFIESRHLRGNDFGIDFRFLKRFSFDINYTIFSENINSQKDAFNMLSALLKYYRIRTQRFDAWFGLGIRRVFNEVHKTRFLLGVGGDLFIAKPVSFSFVHKFATFDNQSVNNTKLFLKYHFKNYRISSGYEHYKLGISRINAFSLGLEVSF